MNWTSEKTNFTGFVPPQKKQILGEFWGNNKKLLRRFAPIGPLKVYYKSPLTAYSTLNFIACIQNVWPTSDSTLNAYNSIEKCVIEQSGPFVYTKICYFVVYRSIGLDFDKNPLRSTSERGYNVLPIVIGYNVLTK